MPTFALSREAAEAPKRRQKGRTSTDWQPQRFRQPRSSIGSLRAALRSRGYYLLSLPPSLEKRTDCTLALFVCSRPARPPYLTPLDPWLPGANYTYAPSAVPTIGAQPYLLPIHHVQDTNSAQQSTVNVALYICASQKLVFSLCSAYGGLCNTDTYIRLYDAQGRQVASNDDYCEFCSQMTVAFTEGCQSYSLHQGCYSSDSCGGRLAVASAPTSIPSVPPTSGPQAQLTIRPTPGLQAPTYQPSVQPTRKPSAPPTSAFPTRAPSKKLGRAPPFERPLLITSRSLLLSRFPSHCSLGDARSVRSVAVYSGWGMDVPFWLHPVELLRHRGAEPLPSRVVGRVLPRERRIVGV